MTRGGVRGLVARWRGRDIELKSPDELDAMRALRETPALEAVATLAGRMLTAAYGENDPPVDATGRSDLRAADAIFRELEGLARWEAVAGELQRGEVVSMLERCSIPADGTGEPGRVVVIDLARARTRSFQVVFVLGLEEGSLPRRSFRSPFLDDETRRALGGR